MDEESIPCIECSHPVLPRTANRHSGKCVPCARGYRENLELSKAFYEEQRRLEKLPDAKYWHSLCKRVADPVLGFNSLPTAEKLFYAVGLLEGEVYNGGFEQYFTNSSADSFQYALRGLEALEDAIGSEITRSAKRLLFADAVVPADKVARFKFLESCGLLNDEETVRILDELDSRFVKNLEDSLKHKIRQFAESNGFW